MTRVNFLRRLYDWTMDLAGRPRADWWLAAIAFAESSFFPIPPDVMLVPMVLARRDKALRFAAICTIASVLGGMLGYAIGFLLFDTLGQWVIHVYGYGDKFDAFRSTYAEYGAWIILIKGLTPIPFKLVTIASGLAGFNFPLFVLLCLITRGLRFFAVALLLRAYGEPIRSFIEKRLEKVLLAAAVLIIGGFAAAHFLF